MSKLIFIISLMAVQAMASGPNNRDGQGGYYQMSFANNVDRLNTAVLSFFAELDHLVPFRTDQPVPEECREKNESNNSVLGANEPSAGQAVDAQPTVLYFNLYVRCVKLIVTSSFADGDVSVNNAKRILGDSGLVKAVGKQAWSQIRFAALSADVQTQVIDRMVLYLVGPEAVLLGKKYIGADNVSENPELVDRASFVAALKAHMLRLSPDLSLADLYANLIIVLRNGPIMKA